MLPVLGGLEVVHTPGHTPGSVCLYGARDRILFVGDVLQRRRGRVDYASGLFSDDHAAAKRAVQRLAGLDVDVIVFSHFPPLTEAASEVLGGPRAAGTPLTMARQREGAATVDTLVDLVQRSAERFDRRPALLIRPSFRTRVWRYRDLGATVPRVRERARRRRHRAG